MILSNLLSRKKYQHYLYNFGNDSSGAESVITNELREALWQSGRILWNWDNRACLASVFSQFSLCNLMATLNLPICYLFSNTK